LIVRHDKSNKDRSQQ